MLTTMSLSRMQLCYWDSFLQIYIYQFYEKLEKNDKEVVISRVGDRRYQKSYRTR